MFDDTQQVKACGALSCGGIFKFVVIKMDDVNDALNGDEFVQLVHILRNIAAHRKTDGRNSHPEYLVINTDEPYITEIIEILKKNGHWG